MTADSGDRAFTKKDTGGVRRTKKDTQFKGGGVSIREHGMHFCHEVKGPQGVANPAKNLHLREEGDLYTGQMSPREGYLCVLVGKTFFEKTICYGSYGEEMTRSEGKPSQSNTKASIRKGDSDRTYTKRDPILL